MVVSIDDDDGDVVGDEVRLEEVEIEEEEEEEDVSILPSLKCNRLISFRNDFWNSVGIMEVNSDRTLTVLVSVTSVELFRPAENRRYNFSAVV